MREAPSEHEHLGKTSRQGEQPGLKGRDDSPIQETERRLLWLTRVGETERSRRRGQREKVGKEGADQIGLFVPWQRI